jgi:hypothetical protein
MRAEFCDHTDDDVWCVDVVFVIFFALLTFLVITSKIMLIDACLADV